METSFAMWGLVAGGAVAVVYALWRLLGRQPDSTFDAGAVSQSWLTEHRAASQGDRFS